MALPVSKASFPFGHEKLLHEVDMELEKEGLGLFNRLYAQFKRFVNPDIGAKSRSG